MLMGGAAGLFAGMLVGDSLPVPALLADHWEVLDQSDRVAATVVGLGALGALLGATLFQASDAAVAASPQRSVSGLAPRELMGT